MEVPTLRCNDFCFIWKRLNRNMGAVRLLNVSDKKITGYTWGVLAEVKTWTLAPFERNSSSRHAFSQRGWNRKATTSSATPSWSSSHSVLRIFYQVTCHGQSLKNFYPPQKFTTLLKKFSLRKQLSAFIITYALFTPHRTPGKETRRLHKNSAGADTPVPYREPVGANSRAAPGRETCQGRRYHVPGRSLRMHWYVLIYGLIRLGGA